MKKKNFIPLIAIAVLCAACHDKTTLTGDWIEPVPGTTNTIQGFSLKENGEATSINMATLQYKSWAQEDNRLILSGESIGNHQTISFSDTLKICKLSEDSLILKKGDLVKTYTRPKSIIPATPIQPAISTTFTVKGKLVIGHEVRSFIAEGDTTSYWIIDDSGTLKEEYEKITFTYTLFPAVSRSITGCFACQNIGRGDRRVGKQKGINLLPCARMCDRAEG